MDEQEAFGKVIEQIKALLVTSPSAHDPDASFGAALSDLAETTGKATEAEELISNALQRFVLHPYLLSWRANVRFRRALGQALVSSDEISFVEPANAVEDLELAARVAPDYLQPRIDHAFHVLNYADDAPRAAGEFQRLVDAMGRQLLECVVGLVDSLREAEGDARAEEVRRHWVATFSDEIRRVLPPEPATGEPADRPPMEIRWYRAFYDVPRVVCVPLEQGELLLTSEFRDDLDEYEDHYTAHWFAGGPADPDLLLEQSRTRPAVARIPVKDVLFDVTKRSTLQLPASTLAALVTSIGDHAR